ncbi:hypothetical protein CONLIGDRAFT_641985 [Coniochaeta ligniaria NRRL 30616]|uniref:Uncharacterized protein n=1 Tax=Coniochaeta ligniaria NRRL 30616 TaxID=1408157 RepID=A0A1J7IYL2_9PEZI|nr:hypothetical protein CONLIGDRAFT_641985 [Coniochaeta ligniaria NRRL 30616]
MSSTYDLVDFAVGSRNHRQSSQQAALAGQSLDPAGTTGHDADYPVIPLGLGKRSAPVDTYGDAKRVKVGQHPSVDHTAEYPDDHTSTSLAPVQAFELSEDDLAALLDQERGVTDAELANAEVISDTPSTATTQSSPGSILCSLLQGPDDLVQSVKQFIGDCKDIATTPPLSPLEGDPQLAGKRTDWPTHDTKVDELWNSVTDAIQHHTRGTVHKKGLAKPTGVLDAVLTCQWHYPTFRVTDCEWGNVLDKNNSSLNFQCRKTGFNPRIRTQDMIPLRHNFVAGGVPWEDLIEGWEHVWQACQTFNKELSSRSKFVIVLGKHNFKTVSGWFTDPTAADEAVPVAINYSGVSQLYGKEPHLLAIRNKATKGIKQLIFFTYHSQYFTCPGVPLRRAEYADHIWNAVCEFAGVEIHQPDAFQRTVVAIRTQNPTPNQLQLAISTCRDENEDATSLTREQALEAFGVTIARNPAFPGKRQGNSSL